MIFHVTARYLRLLLPGPVQRELGPANMSRHPVSFFLYGLWEQTPRPYTGPGPQIHQENPERALALRPPLEGPTILLPAPPGLEDVVEERKAKYMEWLESDEEDSSSEDESSS